MKRLIAILLTAVLLAGGLGGFAYANSNPHIPWLGDKLIGTSRFGKYVNPDERVFYDAQFNFTNPDCVNEIKIEGISIIRDDGKVIYEGPYLAQRMDEDSEIVESTPRWWMEPHRIWEVHLEFFFPDPDDPDHEWMNPEEAINQPAHRYTVEISWGVRRRGGLPLIGEVMSFQRATQSGMTTDSAFGIQMVNLSQRLRSAR